MDDQAARAERQAFLAKLEELTRAVTSSGQKTTETSSRLNVRLRKIEDHLEELNEHIVRFEEFMSSLMETYDDGEDARESIEEIVRNLGEISKFLRKKG